MTPTEQKHFIVDSSVANPAVMPPHLLCSWKSSKMRFHTPVENLSSSLATIMLLPATTASFQHWQVLSGVNMGFMKT
jgi:hypothetical protein